MTTDEIPAAPGPHHPPATRSRPELVAAGALAGLGLDAALSLGAADQQYLQVLAVTAALAPALAAWEVRRGDVVGWGAAVAVAALALAAALAAPATDVPGLDVGLLHPTVLVAVACALVVLVAAGLRHVGSPSGPFRSDLRR